MLPPGNGLSIIAMFGSFFHLSLTGYSGRSMIKKFSFKYQSLSSIPVAQLWKSFNRSEPPINEKSISGYRTCNNFNNAGVVFASSSKISIGLTLIGKFDEKVVCIARWHIIYLSIGDVFKSGKSLRGPQGTSHTSSTAFACKHPELLTAILSVNGMQAKDLSCTPDLPVNAILYGSYFDTGVTPVNIRSEDGYFYEPLENTVTSWKQKFQCNSKKELPRILFI